MMDAYTVFDQKITEGTPDEVEDFRAHTRNVGFDRVLDAQQQTPEQICQELAQNSGKDEHSPRLSELVRSGRVEL